MQYLNSTSQAVLGDDSIRLYHLAARPTMAIVLGGAAVPAQLVPGILWCQDHRRCRRAARPIRRGRRLSSLASNLASTPGRQARRDHRRRLLSSKTDRAVAAERLLSISGRGLLTIDRKFRDSFSTMLPNRISILSNELPRLPDASGVLASRFLIPRSRRSFLGCEDKGLSERLLGELPGILLWAVEGWKRLNARGCFVQPESGKLLLDAVADLGSPVGQFVRERCEVADVVECTAAELYAQYVAWCGENGHRPRDSSWFGRGLLAATGIASLPARRNGSLVRVYHGI